MKMKKFWAGGGTRPSCPPLDPPLQTAQILADVTMNMKSLSIDVQMGKVANFHRYFGNVKRAFSIEKMRWTPHINALTPQTPNFAVIVHMTKPENIVTFQEWD